MDKTDDLLGFVVTADGCEASILVFATKPSKAKLFARGTPWMCDFEWTELRCRREKSVDKYSDQFGAGELEGGNKEEQKIMRELGWYEIDGPTDECIECGLYEWTGVPESSLNYPDNGDPICTQCKSYLTPYQRLIPSQAAKSDNSEK